MQNDLISRSELLKEFDPNGELLDPIAVRMKIVTQTTAYDVEKVVAELRKGAFTDEYGDYSKCEKLIILDEAIDIARNGGKE